MNTSIYFKKINFIKLSTIPGIMLLMLLYNGSIHAHSFARGGTEEGITLDKLTTFTTQLNAEGGKLNVVRIEKEEGEGPILLDKAYLFVNEGLNTGNVHFHNLKVDGITLFHFNMSELNLVQAPETENDPKIRGAEVTHMIEQFTSSGSLEILANQFIEFDFMAAGSNDPLPTPVRLMINVKSSQDAHIHVGLVE